MTIKMRQDTKVQRNVDWWWVATMLLAASLLFLNMGQRSLWWDEIINIYIERQPILLIFSSLNNTPGFFQDIHPPLYHLLMHYWISLTGTSNLALRLPSGLFGLASVGLVYAVGCELGNRRLGRMAAFLTAIGPGGIMYFRMGRYYALTCALGLLATWLFVKLWAKPRRWLWVGYGLTALAMYYTDYLVVTVLASHTVFTIWQNWRSRRDFVIKFLGLQAVVGLAFLPWVPFILAQVGWAGSIIVADLAFSPIGYLFKVLFPFISFSAGETLFPWEIPAIAAYLIFGVLLVLGIMRGQLSPAKRTLLLLLAFVPMLGTITIISFILPTIPFIGVPNRTLFALPYFNLLVGLGWLSLQRRWLQVMVLVVITLAALFGLVNYYRGVHFLNPIYAVSAEELVDFVLANRESGDTVISAGDMGFDYYLQVGQVDLTHYWSYSPATDQIVKDATAPRIWWLTMGRDRTRQDEKEEQFQAQLDDSGYKLIQQQGFVPQDPTYRWVKQKLLGREAYEYKVTINLYALTPP